MPRKPQKPIALSLKDELHCMHLAVRVRAEQVRLRRLEWDTQELALPHISPLPGDSDLQIRTPLTEKDMPRPHPPVARPDFKPGMPSDLMQTMMNLYMDQLRHEHDRNPYNKLASKSAQAKAEAKQEREDARREKIREVANRALQIATAREIEEIKKEKLKS
ncbi:MAG: hypothetical protein ABJO36_04155 [Litorimonas sp.]